MFRSYHFLEWEPGGVLHYKIVDDDFTEHISVRGAGIGIGVEQHIAVIDVYSKKGLNVAANLLRSIMFQVVHRGGPGYSFEEIINANRQYNPKYKQYTQEVEKYITIL